MTRPKDRDLSWMRSIEFMVLLALLALLAPAVASANERHFTYTYETATLSAGQRELEIWSTPRIGRDDYYFRLDQRVELEVGVTDRYQLALYMNATARTAEVTPGVIESQTEFQGISLENKLKLMDPVADPFGFAIYGEVGIGPAELELELKLLFDKRIGDLHLAANLVGELGLEAEGAEMQVEYERELTVEVDLAASYFIATNVSFGLELRNLNLIHDGELEYSALFLGPVVSYSTDDWWLACTILPQLPSLAGHHSGERVLDDREAVEARLLFSVHL